MSKKYMSRPPYCNGDIPDYFMPPMTVEEYKAYEAKYFDFLEPKETMVEQPQQDGVFSRFLQFIGMSKSTTLDDVDKAINDMVEAIMDCIIVTDRVEAKLDCKTATDMVEDESDCKTATDMVEAEAEAEIDMNTDTANYKLKEESNDLVELLNESPENDSNTDDDEVKPKKSFWKSCRKFLRRPFRSCLKTEE